MQKLFVTLLLSLLLIVLNAHGDYLQQSTVVQGTEQKTCKAYLHALPDSKKLPIILTLAGTGIYSTGNMIDENGVLQLLINQNKAVALTIDKPGIEFSENTPEKYKIDNNVYNTYTQKDLIICAKNAIRWVSSTVYSSDSSDIYLFGHSEGSQVATRIYQEALTKEPLFAARVKALFLSGLVMDTWEDIINSQLNEKDKETFWSAIKNRDDKALREFGELAYNYWQDILNTEANKESLKNLSKANAQANFQVYHGLNDANTKVQPIMDFEFWNKEQKLAGKPSLKFSARYYNAGHNLNLSAYNDMIFAFLAFLTP